MSDAFIWAAVGIVLILVTIEVDSNLGGWLLLLIVVGMLYAAHTRTDASTGKPII